MSRAADELVEFVTRTRFEDLPASVVAQTKLVLMDTLAAIFGGSQSPEVVNLARLATQSSSTRSSTIFGHAEPADPRWASLVNATAGTSTELDEGHAYAKGHPAIHTLPAALALGEELDSTGRDILLSIALGYEVAARVGQACNLRQSAHPHGTWGTLGAATAAAKLMPMDATGIRESIDIASSLTLATSFQTAIDGALVRNIYAGMSNQNGLLAAQLATCGFTGERNGVVNVFGKVMSDRFDEKALTGELGERFEITRGYFKIHSCCRYNHATLDAMQLLREEEPFSAQEVKRIQVETYALAAQLHGTRPATTLAARFSIPYAIAIALVRHSTAPTAFDQTALTDARIRALAEKVHVRENPEFTAQTPAKRPACITIELNNGKTISKTVYSSRGDPDQPFTREEMIAKYRALSAPIIGEQDSERALALIEQLETSPSIKPLTQLCRPRRNRDISR